MSSLQTPASSFGVPSSPPLLACWLHMGPLLLLHINHSLGRLTELTKHCTSYHRFIVKVINQNQPKGETQRARLGALGGGANRKLPGPLPVDSGGFTLPSTSMHDVLRVWPTREARLTSSFPLLPKGQAEFWLKTLTL